MTDTGVDSKVLSGSALYRGQPDLSRFPLADNDELVYAPSTRTTAVLSPTRAQILQACRGYATLDQHASRLATEFNCGPQHLGALRQELSSLAQSGLLVAHQDLLGRFLRHPAAQAEPPRLSLLCMPTRNRPEFLFRALRSYAQCAKEFTRELSFLIADQSEDPAMISANAQVLAQLSGEFNLSFFHAGNEDVAEFSRLLSNQSGVPLELVRFALSFDDQYSVAMGANRNALLLASVTETVVQADDDSVCKVAPSPDLKEGLTLTSQYDPTGFWFPSEEESAVLEARFSQRDFFALHEQLLAKHPGRCISEAGLEFVECDQMGTNFVRQALDEGRHVVATSVGLGGDSGIGVANPFLALDGLARGRLVRSESHYRFVMKEQRMMRCASRATISDGAFISGVNIGLDNRQMLPPFLPVHRNEDGVFAHCLRACSVGSIGYLPFMILHLRTQRWNGTTEELVNRAVRNRAGDLIELLITTYQPLPDKSDPVRNTIALGRWLAQWGCAPPSELEEMLRIALTHMVSRQISNLEARMRKYGSYPPFWSSDVNLCLSAMRSALIDENLVVARDLLEVFGIEEARIRLRRLLRCFGELLQVWPDLRQASASLKERGWQLGKRSGA